MGKSRRTYLPAAGHDWLLPLYDPLLKFLGVESARRELIDHAAIRPNHRVLDSGCGPGSLVILIKQCHSDAEVVGLDPDPKVLVRGKRKAERAGISVQFDQGFSDELPYPESSFDRVLSSFMFSHLKPEEKKNALNEVRRILRPSGSFHLLDFGGAEARADGLLARLLHSTEHLQDNFEGRLSRLMGEMGFDSNEVVGRATVLGRIAYYRASLQRSEGDTT